MNHEDGTLFKKKKKTLWTNYAQQVNIRDLHCSFAKYILTINKINKNFNIREVFKKIIKEFFRKNFIKDLV